MRYAEMTVGETVYLSYSESLRTLASKNDYDHDSYSIPLLASIGELSNPRTLYSKRRVEIKSIPDQDKSYRYKSRTLQERYDMYLDDTDDIGLDLQDNSIQIIQSYSLFRMMRGMFPR